LFFAHNNVYLRFSRVFYDLAVLCWIILIVWIYKNAFFHSPTEGHLDCYQVWAVKNKVAINILAQVSVWTAHLGKCQEIIMLDPLVRVLFSFPRNHQSVFLDDISFCFPTPSEGKSLLLHILASIWSCHCSGFWPS
jgi:hypothetical protein